MWNHARQQTIYQTIHFALVSLALLLGGIPGTVLAVTPTQDWVARYNSTGNGADQPSALAVDTAGNTYVTGNSGTIKYSASGSQLWIVPNGGAVIAVDNVSNSIYVTGSATGTSTTTDFSTIKYDANGNQQWVKFYNGPSNGGDYATALALDAAGNVYVTGSSSTWGTSMGMYYATVKYDANGNQLWVARYNGGVNDIWASSYAVAIAVDAS